MGQAIRTSHENRRAEIIETARAVLAEKGPAALTLRHIADEVGIKLASLQYHIPNKAALIKALAEDVVQHYEQHLNDYVQDDSADPEHALEEIIRWIRSPKKGKWRLIHRLEVQFWAMALLEPDVAQAQHQFFQGYRQFLAALICRINPALGRAEAVQRGALMSVMIDGCALITSELQPRDPQLKHLTDELVTTALALAKRPPS
ncbi:MAG: TetR/AcrR family transcriptional regulator [bacterium]